MQSGELFFGVFTNDETLSMIIDEEHLSLMKGSPESQSDICSSVSKKWLSMMNIFKLLRCFLGNYAASFFIMQACHIKDVTIQMMIVSLFGIFSFFIIKKRFHSYQPSTIKTHRFASLKDGFS